MDSSPGAFSIASLLNQLVNALRGASFRHFLYGDTSRSGLFLIPVQSFPSILKVVALLTTNLIQLLTVLIRRLISAVASVSLGSPMLSWHLIQHCNLVALYS